MGLVILKFIALAALFGALYWLLKSAICLPIWAGQWISRKIHYAKLERNYATIRAQRQKAANDRLMAATARANAFIKEHDAEKARKGEL